MLLNLPTEEDQELAGKTLLTNLLVGEAMLQDFVLCAGNAINALRLALIYDVRRPFLIWCLKAQCFPNRRMQI